MSKYKAIFSLILILALLSFMSGCIKGEVQFKRDGSGVATITVEKDDAMTLQKLKDDFNKVLLGVATQSEESGKVSIKKIKEFDSYFKVDLSFKRISDISGLGYYRFTDGLNFGSQRMERALFSNFEKGKFSLKGSNYNNSTYTVHEDLANSIMPIDVKSGQTINAQAFNEQQNEFYSKKNTVFVFMLCGLENITNIEFSFPGKILITSDKGNALINDKTISVTPFNVSADVIGVLEDGVTGFRHDNITTNAFMGYVIFENDADYTLAIVLSILVVLLIAGILTGVYTGYFKRVINGRNFKLVIKNRILYMFVLPGFMLMLIFNYIPMAGIMVAFKNYTVDGGMFGSEWVGFKHFVTLFTHPGAEFWMIFRNTVVMAFLKFVFGFPSSIILALMFNALLIKPFKKVVQTISYLPYFVSWVVVSNLSYILLTSNGGIINNALASFNLNPIKFYSETKYWWGILTVSSIWKNLGWGTIIYLAAITGINPDLYEAASIDGASTRHKLWNVTLPGMMPVIGIQLILSAGSLIKDDFDQIYTMVGGNNYTLRKVTEVFSSLVYRQLQGGVSGFSSATAVSLVQSVISLTLVLFSNRLIKKTDNQGLW